MTPPFTQVLNIFRPGSFILSFYSTEVAQILPQLYLAVLFHYCFYPTCHLDLLQNYPHLSLPPQSCSLLSPPISSQNYFHPHLPPHRFSLPHLPPRPELFFSPICLPRTILTLICLTDLVQNYSHPIFLPRAPPPSSCRRNSRTVSRSRSGRGGTCRSVTIR